MHFTSPTGVIETIVRTGKRLTELVGFLAIPCDRWRIRDERIPEKNHPESQEIILEIHGIWYNKTCGHAAQRQRSFSPAVAGPPTPMLVTNNPATMAQDRNTFPCWRKLRVGFIHCRRYMLVVLSQPSAVKNQLTCPESKFRGLDTHPPTFRYAHFGEVNCSRDII